MQASINGTQIDFEDFGRGPAVILLHGLPFNRNVWKPQIPRLAEQGYRVIAPDLRGFGQSASGEKPFCIRILADDIAKLMNHLGIGRAVIIGMSLGAEVAMEMLKRHSRKVVAASLVAPLLPPIEAADKNRLWSIAELVREGHLETAVESLCHWFFKDQGTLKEPDIKENFRQMASKTDAPTLAQALSFWESYRGRCGRREHHSHPVLLLTAEHDESSPPQFAADLLRLFSRGRHQVLPGAGIMATLEVPGMVNRVLLDFLKEVSHCKPGRLRLAADRVRSGFGLNVLQKSDAEAETIQEGILTA